MEFGSRRGKLNEVPTEHDLEFDLEMFRATFRDSHIIVDEGGIDLWMEEKKCNAEPTSGLLMTLLLQLTHIVFTDEICAY